MFSIWLVFHSKGDHEVSSSANTHPWYYHDLIGVCWPVLNTGLGLMLESLKNLNVRWFSSLDFPIFFLSTEKNFKCTTHHFIQNWHLDEFIHHYTFLCFSQPECAKSRYMCMCILCSHRITFISVPTLWLWSFSAPQRNKTALMNISLAFTLLHPLLSELALSLRRRCSTAVLQQLI